MYEIDRLTAEKLCNCVPAMLSSIPHELCTYSIRIWVGLGRIVACSGCATDLIIETTNSIKLTESINIIHGGHSFPGGWQKKKKKDVDRLRTESHCIQYRHALTIITTTTNIDDQFWCQCWWLRHPPNTMVELTPVMADTGRVCAMTNPSGGRRRHGG